MDVMDTGAGITVPVGEETLGRILNVIGEPVDEAGPVNTKKSYPIHRPTPEFVDQETKVQAFETGIKVVDLLAPYPAVERSACSAVLVSEKPSFSWN